MKGERSGPRSPMRRGSRHATREDAAYAPVAGVIWVKMYRPFDQLVTGLA